MFSYPYSVSGTQLYHGTDEQQIARVSERQTMLPNKQSLTVSYLGPLRLAFTSQPLSRKAKPDTFPAPRKST